MFFDVTNDVIQNKHYFFTGTELPISKVPSRIVLLQTMIFSLLLYNYYSASIVSARLSEPLEKINDSMNELAKLSNFKYGAEKSLFFQSYITVITFCSFFNRFLAGKFPNLEKITLLSLIRCSAKSCKNYPKLVLIFKSLWNMWILNKGLWVLHQSYFYNRQW